MNDRCNYCRLKVDRKWNFCPKCGVKTDRRVTMFDILKNQMNVLRNLMANDNEYESRTYRSNGVTIRINSSSFGEPNVHVLQRPVPVNQGQPYKEKRQEERKLTGRIIEPKVNVRRLDKEIVITVPLPDVKSEGDIEVNRFTDSIEIRAFAGDKGYFKILNIPQNQKLVGKSLDNGMLNLKFAI
ncbi:MAG: hypothetical protein COW21_04320 [Candidatus Aenigmarchaeota archaeon CG15_BIG_FIL_POST_REV_8_21_14_020_37_27]|nr:MAG: hypothetical protein COS07_04375 [Candidatus Aenigmarchaeota archaeon CG01_land_8_20_14_3_00_37_9]PIW40967.1 MAG: hypothetical protein COW21_04320 [Candidatus Aenigmarchaeota archaeon CG15_BIG_FIL_POST_REV_8_21_14_020_37_27]